MFKPKVILYPTDFSDCSRFAFSIAADLAREHGATLVVLHVVETLGPEKVTFGEVGSQLEPEGYRRRLEEKLHALAPTPLEVSVQYVLAEGNAAREIIRVAGMKSCDLIVMGTHGRTGLDRLLVGSVAEQVIRQAPCPVLTSKGSRQLHAN